MQKECATQKNATGMQNFQECDRNAKKIVIERNATGMLKKSPLTGMQQECVTFRNATGMQNFPGMRQECATI
jgi:hypothetical protein